MKKLFFLTAGIFIILSLNIEKLQAQTRITPKKERMSRIKTAQRKKTKIISDISKNMVLVKGGFFLMGCTTEQGNDCQSDETPSRVVNVNNYKINKFEVTQQEWRAIMGYNPSHFDYCPKCPVTDVSFKDVTEFIKRLNNRTGKNFRLPTEAEWEYAARGGAKSKNYKFSGSNNLDEVGWYRDNSNNIPHVVGVKAPNELGLYDMSGNVLEWCYDFYKKEYYAESDSPIDGPIDIEKSNQRVARGGNWNSKERYCRVSNRMKFAPDYCHYFFGFRLAKD